MKIETFFYALTLVSATQAFTLLTPGHMNNSAKNAGRCTPSSNVCLSASISRENEVKPVESVKPKVQRFYETYEWTNPDSDQTYNINYRVEGKPTDPPILLIHGFGANVNHFRNNFPLLTQAGYRVYAIDLLGFGGSDKPKDETFSIELWVNLLCDFVRDMSNGRNSEYCEKKWVVCGNSIGGLCALGVTATIPNFVRGCTLFNCAQGMTIFREEETPFWLTPLIAFFKNVILDPNGYGGKFFENFKTKENVESILKTQGVYGDTRNVDEELLEILLGPSNDDGAKEVFLKVFGGDAGPTPESYLAQIDQPILALWGSDDPWVPVDKGNHQGLKFGDYTKGDYKLVVLEGAGHCPMDEEPEKIHAEMEPWLASLPVV